MAYSPECIIKTMLDQREVLVEFEKDDDGAFVLNDLKEPIIKVQPEKVTLGRFEDRMLYDQQGLDLPEDFPDEQKTFAGQKLYGMVVTVDGEVGVRVSL
jgi:hypothetical protein